MGKPTNQPTDPPLYGAKSPAKTWSHQAPGLLAVTYKLQEIQLRLVKIDLVQKLQRACAMLQALAPRPPRE